MIRRTAAKLKDQLRPPTKAHRGSTQAGMDTELLIVTVVKALVEYGRGQSGRFPL
jgi:phosphoglucomutase